MPLTATPNETREMRLTSLALGERGPLSMFIARRRLPGESWRSWEQISFDLHAEIGELITREGIRRWAGKYGIPEDTRATDGPKLTTAYLRALKRVGIDVA